MVNHDDEAGGRARHAADRTGGLGDRRGSRSPAPPTTARLGYHLAGDTCVAQPWLAQDMLERAARGRSAARWDAGSIRSASSTATLMSSAA